MRKLLLAAILLLGLMLLLPRARTAQAQATSTPTNTATATITPSMSVTPAIWHQGVTSTNQGYQVKYSADLGDILLFVGQIAIVALAVALMLVDQAKRSS